MPANSFGKFLIPAALSTGAVFSALMTPLLMFSDQSVTFSNSEGQIAGLTLKDVSAPYTGIVGLISLGLGASSIAAAGLRSSARQGAQAHETFLARQQQLEAREAALQQALTSEHFLDQSGLSFFLEDEASSDIEPVLHPGLTPAAAAPTAAPVSAAPVSAAPVSAAPVSAAPVSAALVSAPIVAPTAPIAALQWVSTTPAQPVAAQPIMAQAVVAPPVSVKPVATLEARLAMSQSVMGFVQPTSASRAAAAAPTFAVAVAEPAEPAWVPATRPALQSMVTPWPAAQGFLSFARPGTAQGESGWSAAMTAQDQASIAQIHALQFQLQQIVSQIESLQTDLQPEPALQIFETVSYPEAPLPVPVRPHRSEWVVQRVAS
jgi:hypothetical protein